MIFLLKKFSIVENFIYLCKMKQLTLFMLALLCLSACKPEKRNTNIPDAPIYFRLSLSNYSTFANGMGSVLSCPTDLIGSDKAGTFGYSGTVLLINNFPDYSNEPFSAYDACCTNPVCVDGKNKVSAEILATCSHCGSMFDLSVGGLVRSGAAKYPLRRYRVDIYGFGNARTLAVSRYEY